MTSTLAAGAVVPPAWPFSELAADLPDRWLTDPTDSRARLALHVTSPTSPRFAEVIANRIWARLFGHGIVEPVDDWERGTNRHPALLAWLGRRLVLDGYDLRAFTRRLVLTETYARRPLPSGDSEETRLPRTPSVKRMEAEQVVDSLFAISGKPLHADDLNIDRDNGRLETLSIAFGRPARAWEFLSLSNERDRPGLSLPYARPFVQLLQAFGWRGARQNPITRRGTEVNVLQPASLANGVIARRFATLSDDSRFTALALEDETLERLIRETWIRVLTRPPRSDEIALFTDLLEPGFGDRRRLDEPVRMPAPPQHSGVAWSNHLKPGATTRQTELEVRVRAGDPPTRRLDPDWRRRYEDMLWALANSPEFLFLP